MGLLAGVIWLHGLLITALMPLLPPRAGQAEGRAAVMQVRTVGVVTPSPPPPLAVAVATPSPRPTPTPSPELVAASPKPPLVADQGLPVVLAHTVLAKPVAGATKAAGAASANALPNVMPTLAAATNVASTAIELDDPSDPAAAALGDAPPVYPTRLPAPVLLRYGLHYNGQSGWATLAWRHDGRHYSLQLDGRNLAHALVEQLSSGGFDPAGLAPDTFADRRGGRRQQAAHFRRDTGRVSFSGPALDHPAWPGAQDRLSWVAQLAAIRLAATSASASKPGADRALHASPSTVSLFVVDARGAGAMWHFVDQGEVLLTTALGTLPAQLWRREPPRPEGLRVETWLDPSRGYWPLQLRFTALRSGDVFEMSLATEPSP